MNFDFLDSEKFKNAYNKQITTFFPQMPMPEVTWDDVLQFTNDNDEKRTGKKMLSSQYSFFHNEAQIISSVNSFVKQVHSRFSLCFKDQKVVTCQLFGCTKIENSGQIIYKHEDRENNIYWQGKGKTRWRLYDSLENEQPFMDIVLEEKDILYVPGGTYHYVEPITPRFGFSILFGDRYNEL
jgi:cupin superfamily acireductone dioxygenase involved in methionine salvage